MKQILLRALAITACVAFSFAGAQAQLITAERAQEIANNFFQNGKQKSAAVRSTTATSLKKSADSRILSNGSSNEAPTFHILTDANGEGFVIVSGEEIENPIIGYSFEGTIDTNDLPVGFVDYITDIDAQVKALRKYNAENPQKAAAARSAMQKTNYNATTMGEQVVLLETAKWGQDYPFNAQCFTSYNGSTNALTGCVPTAFAIIMRYHEWPQVGTGTLYNRQAPTYVEITDRTYDYSKMPLVYDSNWTEEQKNEVAKLMSHLGHAFGVSYGTGETSVSMGNSQTEATKKYFNYQDCYISNQYNNGSLTDFTEWKNNLKNSLDNNCPVPYGANNIGSGAVDARHMFVVDGYTDDDYFHFNFGWNGGSNGWYKLDAITVGYSWSDDANGYTSKHQAFFNLTPDKTKYPVTATVEPENAGTVTVNPAEQIEGGIVTLAATANTGYTFQNWTKGGEVVSTNKSCTVKVASSDNDYVANFLTVGNTTVNVSVTYNSSYGTVTGTSGTVANGTTLTPRLNEEVTLTATPADGYIFNGWTVTKGTESTNYSGTSLTFVATGEMNVTANFTLAVQDYVVNPTTGTLNNGTNRSSVWTFTTVGDFTAALSISATDSNGNVVNSITNKTSGTAGHYFAPSGIIANTETPSSSPTIYTISVPNGYKITGYAIKYYPENGSITLTNELGHNETATDSSSDYYLNASGLNVQSTTYTVAGTGRMTTLSFSVTVMKDDGTGGGSTPTPTQYTITATANPGTAGSVTGGGTYNEDATVTLTATPNSGYEFVNWTSGTTTVSTNATYSFTANASASYVANFQAANPTTFAVTTTANPAAGGTATFAVGTNPATSSATVASGTGVTLYAVANDGYRFVNWTKGGIEVSTNATHNVTITEASDYVANFEKEATATEYPTPTGNTYTNNYLTSITTTGGDTNIDYSANAHPGQKLVVVPGKVQLAKGESFTMNLVAYSLGAGSNSETREDMRYCHASLFTDFDQDFTFQAERVQGWGVKGPSGTNPYAGGNSNVYGNYDLVMNITHTITVPDDAPTGESHVRMIYTNAWKEWPTNGTAELDKGIVYDIVVEVVEKVDITANAGEGGSVTINGEATGTKRVIKGSSVTLNATPASGYSFLNWSNAEGIVSETAEYTFTANGATTLTANFERITCTVNVNANPGTAGTATVATGTDPGSSSIEVEPETSVTLTATPAGGYVFANWTNNLNTDIVTENPYTPTVAADVTYTANFEPIVVTATLTDAQDNIYIVEVDGFTEEVTTASVATKLTEKYPFIKLGDDNNSITLSGSGTAYTYTNTVVLPFKVDNSEDTYLHNTYIYWLQGNDYPVYISGLNATDTYVSKVTGDYAYGDHPIYNTYDGNSMISWTIYNVNNSFEFIFKNEKTGMYMQVTDVAATNAQNTKFVERANATTFTLVKGDGEGLYALTANINGTPGYLCSTETAYGFTTFSNNINYAWLKFTEAEYMSRFIDLEATFFPLFDKGNGRCIVTEEIQAIKEDFSDGYGDMTLNTIISYTNTTYYVMNNWPTIKLNITPENSGTTAINGEEGVTTKRAPADYQFPIAATPATGYHFVNWTKGTETVNTETTHNVTINGEKGDVTEFTANFAINIYTINVTAEGNGVANTNAATVEHGNSVTLTATPETNNEFTGWYNGEELVSTENPYTFTATSDINYTANFQEEAVTYTISVSADPVEGGIVTGGGTYDKGANATLTATPNANYNFVNWTKNGVEVGTDATMIIENITANAEYVAKFNYTGSFVAITTSVETIGGGEGGTVTGGGNYANGGTVTLTATPSGTNYRFMGWYNDNNEQVSTAATFEFTATANAKYTAKFIKRVYIEIIQPDMINDQGQPDKGYGFAYTWIGNGTQYKTTVDYGTEVTINVLVYDHFNSDVEFAYWSIDNEKISQENPYTFTATEDRYEFLANFNLKATLAVESGDNGLAYIGSEGTTSKEVVTGNTYTISAKANSGYTFDYWAKISGTDETKVSSSAVYTFVLTASLNETVTYKAYFKEITELEDGKAYRIKARMHDGKYRYIYRDGNQIKWKDSQDNTNNSIFIAQYDFTANDGSLNLISAVGDLGWNYGGDMGDTYVALKTVDGTVEGTFTLYGISGTEHRSYTAFSSTGTNTTGDEINYYTTKDGSINKVVNTTDNGTTDFIFEEVPFEFNVGIANGSNAKLGTINLPFATTVHPSITAYAVTGSDENYAYVAPLTLENNILPANTPVLVEAEEAGTYGFAPAPASNEKHETGFAGTLGAKEIADEVNAYILSYKGAGTAIKLYKLASDDRTINANKAYYIDEAGNSSAISFKFVGTTDIDGVESEDENAKGIYDLQGRKLSEITEPGIYIVDGKKIMVK